MPLRPLRRLLPLALLCAALAATHACRMGVEAPGDWIPAEGEAVKAAWKPAAAARTEARKAALAQARVRLWQQLIDEPVGATTLGGLAAADPVFEARLRAMLASVRPETVEETPDGAVRVVVRFNREPARALARERMR